MSEGIHILVLDDEASIRWVIKNTLADSGHHLHFTASAEEAVRLLAVQPMALVLVDIHLPGADGFSFLRDQRALHPHTLMAVITGEGSMEHAVTAMKLGAFDYLTKPFDITEIESLVQRAVRAGQNEQAIAPLPRGGGDLIVGTSSAVREIHKSIGRVAATEIGVLIQGESGTGKELIAQAIHRHSGREAEPFVALNCAAIPRELLESELFGHEKGAFTGAVGRKRGQLEAAGGGTLFLDEIGDMDLALQAKLLRVLQEREIQRVGGLQALPFRARVLAATNRSLLEVVDAGGFRADLYYRLGQYVMQAPPLRERPKDIPLLAAHFLRNSARRLGLPEHAFSIEALERLCAHHWPGNVRELENAVKSMLIMARTPIIDLSCLPQNIASSQPQERERTFEKFEKAVLDCWRPCIERACAEGSTGLLHKLSAHLERALLRQVLHNTAGNQLRAAAVLGINRNTLRVKMRVLGIAPAGKQNGSRRRAP